MELDDKLKEIDIENFIWVIYIGIIILSWYSNSLEKKYFIYNDIDSKNKYRMIMIIIFITLVVIYAYFLNGAFKDIKNIDFNHINKNDYLKILSFIASLLVFISGIIYLYILYNDNDIGVEIAFN